MFLFSGGFTYGIAPRHNPAGRSLVCEQGGGGGGVPDADQNKLLIQFEKQTLLGQHKQAKHCLLVSAYFFTFVFFYKFKKTTNSFKQLLKYFISFSHFSLIELIAKLTNIRILTIIKNSHTKYETKFCIQTFTILHNLPKTTGQ